MKANLRNALIEMNDEDFYELEENMKLSSRLRALLQEGADHDDIVQRLDIDLEDLDYVLTGAFGFTTQNMAAITVMEHDMENDGMINIVDDTDKTGDNSDIPDQMNYDAFNQLQDTGDVKRPVYVSHQPKVETEFEKMQKEVYDKHQEKLKKQSENVGSEDNPDFIGGFKPIDTEFFS